MFQALQRGNPEIVLLDGSAMAVAHGQTSGQAGRTRLAG